MGSLENRLDSLDEQMIQGPTPFQSCHHQALRIATLTRWTASIAKPREWRQGSAHGKSGFGRGPVAESRDPFPLEAPRNDPQTYFLRLHLRKEHWLLPRRGRRRVGPGL